MNTHRKGRQRSAGMLALLLAALLFGLFFGCSRTGKRPNILLITLDTTRADRIGCYGYALAATPHLDGLAERGVLFERAYTTIPFTLPAHTSMLTGLYPPEHGLRLNGKNSLHPSIPVVTEQLKEAGYDTGAFLASFVLGAKFGLNRGFDVYDDRLEGAEKTLVDLHQYRNGRLVTDAALSWLASLKGNQPFFCWVHLYDPHTPYHAHRDRYGEQYVERPYDAEVRFMDEQVGRLFSFLEAEGKLDRTLVIALGDHGEGLGDHGEATHGNMLYDSTLHVPMIFAWPGRTGPVRNDDPVSVMSVAPSILDAAGLPFAVHHGAGSLEPALRGETVACRVLYAETDEPFVTYGWSPLRSIREGPLKYIQTTSPELYDLPSDPGEEENLAQSREESALNLADLLAETQATMQEGETVTAHLTRKEQAVLESLGYIGGATPAPTAVSGGSLPDIKDRIHLVNMVEDAHEAFRLGGTNEALSLLADVVQQEPGQALFYKYLGRTQLSAGLYDEVIRTADRFLVREPDRPDLLQLRGEACMGKGAHAEAVEAFERILRASPDLPDSLSNLASALIGLGRYDEAFPLLERALAAGGDPQALRHNLALGYEKAGRLEEALAQWRAVSEADPMNVFAYRKAETISRQLQAARGQEVSGP